MNMSNSCVTLKSNNSCADGVYGGRNVYPQQSSFVTLMACQIWRILDLENDLLFSFAAGCNCH